MARLSLCLLTAAAAAAASTANPWAPTNWEGTEMEQPNWSDLEDDFMAELQLRTRGTAGRPDGKAATLPEAPAPQAQNQTGGVVNVRLNSELQEAAAEASSPNFLQRVRPDTRRGAAAEEA
mmetsp:Transcript_120614/g.375541  ORF Transcript_120614/g.375541 Transcript_120614/m.375541 type:complete len:121 (-) Transcript_120614:43-405(-)